MTASLAADSPATDRDPFPISLRLLAAAAATFAALAIVERTLGQALIPLIRGWLSVIDPDFRTVDLSIVARDVGDLLRWTVTVNREFVVAGHIVSPDARGLAESSLRVDFVFEAVAIEFALIAAWPSASARAMARRLLWALPLACLVMLVDAPMALLAGVWGLVTSAFDPGGSYPLLMWADFLRVGGREFLGVAAGVGSIALAARAPRTKSSLAPDSAGSPKALSKEPVRAAPGRLRSDRRRSRA